MLNFCCSLCVDAFLWEFTEYNLLCISHSCTVQVIRFPLPVIILLIGHFICKLTSWSNLNKLKKKQEFVLYVSCFLFIQNNEKNSVFFLLDNNSIKYRPIQTSFSFESLFWGASVVLNFDVFGKYLVVYPLIWYLFSVWNMLLIIIITHLSSTSNFYLKANKIKKSLLYISMFQNL